MFSALTPMSPEYGTAKDASVHITARLPVKEKPGRCTSIFVCGQLALVCVSLIGDSKLTLWCRAVKCKAAFRILVQFPAISSCYS